MIDMRSRAGSLDTTHTESEHECVNGNGLLYLDGEGGVIGDTNSSLEGRGGGTYQYQPNHLQGQGVTGNDEYRHDDHNLFATTFERQKNVELAAETMWEGIVASKNDLVMSTRDATVIGVVEME